MKIVALQAENIKKLVAVEIRPDGNLVEITGRNGQGKTSVLDSIWWALAGASSIQTTPIRKGQTSAKIRLDLGEIIVTRSFKAGKDGEATSSIAVETAKGARFSSPQAMLDELLGQLTFDPLAFSRMDAKAQFDTLRRFVPGVDFDGIDSQNRDDYARRTEINRQAKEARAAANKIEVPATLSPNEIDESALVDELQKAASHNADIEVRQGNRMNAAATVRTLRDEAKDLYRQAEEKEKRAAELQEKIDTAPKLPQPIDVSELREKIAAAKSENESLALWRRKQEYVRAADDLEAKSEELTATMDEREADKLEAIAAAKLPVEGIGFGNGVILLNGVPFDQASDAEQLRASIAIAMALNPKLRVIRVRDGSLLDSQSLALLAEMAEEQDYQVWVERVDGSGKVGFVMENGLVKSHEVATA